MTIHPPLPPLDWDHILNETLKKAKKGDVIQVITSVQREIAQKRAEGYYPEKNLDVVLAGQVPKVLSITV